MGCMGGRCSGGQRRRSVTTRAVVWFRRDLRLGDNPAWAAATQSVDRVVALYVLDPILFAAAGQSRRRQLLAHLHGLDQSLRVEGGRLLVLRGDPKELVPQVAEACNAVAVYANADVTPYARHRDLTVKAALRVDFAALVGHADAPTRFSSDT